jgi:hypothetical protein
MTDTKDIFNISEDFIRARTQIMEKLVLSTLLNPKWGYEIGETVYSLWNQEIGFIIQRRAGEVLHIETDGVPKIKLVENKVEGTATIVEEITDKVIVELFYKVEVSCDEFYWIEEQHLKKKETT